MSRSCLSRLGKRMWWGLFALLLFPTTAEAAVDLSMSTWSSTASALGYNSTVRVTARVRNSGTTNAGAFEVSVYYGDSTSAVGLSLLGKTTVRSLAAGATSSTLVLTARLPRNVLYGQRYLHYLVDSGSQVRESNENNNRGSRPLLITGQPNLRVTYLLSTPTTQARTGYLTISYRVYNAGYSRTNNTFLGIYFSTDATITTSDTLLTRPLLPGLQAFSYYPGRTNGTVTVRLPSNAATGRRYIGAYIDSTNTVVETSESDNTRSYPITVTTSAPELSLASLSFPTTVTAAGTRATLTSRVRNTGNADARPFYVYFYYGDNTTTTGLTYIGRSYISALKAGQTTGNLLLGITWPTTVRNGTRYLHYTVDATNANNEIFELNNRGTRTIRVTGRPNLQVSRLTLTPTTQVRGGQISVLYRIYNEGVTRVGSIAKLRLYYSSNTNINTRDTYLNVELNIRDLRAKESYQGTAVVTVPTSATVNSTRYIGAIIDYDTKITETSETDNTRAASFRVGASAADLDMSTWTSTSTARGAGSDVKLTFTVRNRGNANAAAFVVNFYYGDSTSTSGLTSIGSYSFASGLRANSTATAVVRTFKLPNNVLFGTTRRIHYWIDATSKVTEVSETNNRGSRAINITGRPDIVISTLYNSPSSQIKGGNTTTYYRVYNAGYSRVPRGFYVGFYYSTDTTITTADSYMNRAYISSLNARSYAPASTNGTITLRVPTNATVGRRYVGAIGDLYRYFTETSETNNTRAATLNVITAIANLRLSSLTAPSSANGSGTKVTLRFNVRNDGAANAGRFYIYFYYNDSTSTTGLTYLGRSYFSAGLAKTTTSPTTTLVVTLPATVLYGRRYLHYYVDALRQVGESTEADNRGSRAINITGLPNLQVSYLVRTPTSQVRNGQMLLTYRVTNRGASRLTASSLLGVYYSNDSTITTRDTYRTRVTIGALNAGASSPVGTITTTVPSNALTGTRYIGLIADYNSRIRESSETDNTRAAAFTVTTSVAELSMSSFTAPSSALGTGSKLTVTFAVRNTGSADAGRFYVAFYYGDSTATTGLTYLGRYYFTTGLGKGKTSASIKQVVTLPGTVLFGARRLHYNVDYARQVSESIETNNQGSRALTITGRPDIQISVLSATPTSQVKSGLLNVTYRIYNAGYSRTATYFDTRFYYSTDAAITTSDTYTGRWLRLSLNGRSYYGSSGNATTTITVPSSATNGRRYLGIIADYNARVAETSETNNARAFAFNVISNQADLDLATFTAPTSTTGAGDRITVSIAARNRGTADAGAFSVGVYFGSSTSTASLTLLGKIDIAGLAKGKTDTTKRLVVTLPNSIYDGARYLHYYVDYTNKINEISESNNRGRRTLTITGKPDLQVSVLSVSPTSQIQNGQMTVTFRITNKGKSRGYNFYTRLYYSADATITTGDTYLGRSYYIRDLDAGATSAEYKTTITVPRNAVNGRRYIGVYADYSNRDSETSETNNTRAAAFTVTNSIADLYLASATITSSAVGSGSNVSAIFTVRNNGSKDAGAFDVSFYYSDSTSRSGWVELGKRAIPSLKARTTTGNLALTFKLPANALAGRRYIHWRVDSGEKIAESSETNNYSYRVLNVTGKPNLRVSVLTATPTSQFAGGNIQLNYRVDNTGPVAAAGFTLRFYYSTNSTITTGDTVLRSVFVARVNAGAKFPASANGSTTVTLPTTARSGATVYLGAFVDFDNKVAESSETDNTRAVAIKVTSKQADLVASTLSVTPTKAQAGKAVSVRYSYANRGAVDAGAFTVSVYFSTDNNITTGDTRLTSWNVASLKVGATSTSTRSVTLPATLNAGRGYIGIFVDSAAKVSETDEKNNTRAAAIDVLVDKDKDGVTNDKDCNDNDKDVYPGAKELCDGKDNNCDKKIDEGCPCVKGKTRACYTGSAGCTKQSNGSFKCTTPCQAGTQTCDGKGWGTCAGEAGPQKEVCDGKDNDCDGKIDNTPGQSTALTETCYSGPAGTAGKGECKEGTRTCRSGKLSACVGESKPGKEICDNKDNDCDGKIDNEPGKSTALTQACTTKCGTGTETCQSGKYGTCSAPTSCESKPENPGEVPTDSGSGEVPTDQTTDAGPGDGNPDQGPGDGNPDQGPKDGTPDQGPGDGIQPDDGCYTTGCPSGEICQQGACVKNPCDGVSCQSDEFCRAGQCVKVCGCGVCQAGEKCVDGSCQTDNCASVACNNGEICDPSNGQCITDPCASVTCGKGRVCQAGQCVDDVCAVVTCPTDYQCKDGQCNATNCSNEKGEVPGDAGSNDAGPSDQGGNDQSPTDQGSTDQGSTDQGTTDQGGADTPTDGGTDSGTTDTTTTESTTGNDNSTQPKDDDTAAGGGCCSIHNKQGPSPFVLFLGFLMLMLPIFRRRRK